MALMKFFLNHKIHWLELDPVTGIVLMLGSGAYGLGPSWIASAHGGKLDAMRFACFMKAHTNGLLAANRGLVTQIMFGEPNDDSITAMFKRSRNAALEAAVPLDLCRSMTLDELKGLEKNNLSLPPRLLLLKDMDRAAKTPHALVLDFGSALSATAVRNAPTSAKAISMLIESGAEVNPLLVPLMQNQGDIHGVFAAAYVHETLNGARSHGLLEMKDTHYFHLMTEALETVSHACRDGQVALNDVEATVRFLLKKYLANEDPATMLEYELSFDTTFDALQARRGRRGRERGGGEGGTHSRTRRSTAHTHPYRQPSMTTASCRLTSSSSTSSPWSTRPKGPPLRETCLTLWRRN